MPRPVKRPDLDAIEAEAKATSKGSWRWEGTSKGENGGPPYVPQGSHLGSTLISLDDTYENAPYDCAFIASSRTNVLKLVAYARALEAQFLSQEEKIQALNKELTDLTCQLDPFPFVTSK